MSMEPGQVFAGYTILRVLGSGGMGRVYLAAHPRLPREEALKVLPADVTADPQFRERFEREAELAAGLSHPHIVGIHDRGEDEGRFWISMEYVPGTDVARLLRERFRGGLPVAEAMAIVTAVASALDYAHHRAVLHRDVKPSNILVTEPDAQPRRVYLADFGVARRVDDGGGPTSAAMAVGTAAYAAPEQLMAGRVDGRADQYALACTAFHLLAGVPPYRGESLAVVIGQHVSAPPPSIGAHRPELAALDPVFATAMAKEPAGRFDSCGEFARQLTQRLAAHPEPALDPTVLAPRAKSPGRRRAVLAGALATTVLAVAGGVTLVAGPKLAGTQRPAVPPDPFTGTYRADLGPAIGLDDVADPAAPPAVTRTYGLRSGCRPTGCVMTAQLIGGEPGGPSALVFDQIDGNWVAVALAADKCRETPEDFWHVFRLRARPDGGLAGEYTMTAADGCGATRTVTVTRTRDGVVEGVPDPARQPPRVVSPAQALRGRYRITRSTADGTPQPEMNTKVSTDCLRTGDRCMSYFHEPSGDLPLVFENGRWAWSIDSDITCPRSADTARMKATGQDSLPQPAGDPIAKLTGHGHLHRTPPCEIDTDFDETFTRTGD
ncbi:hypothetical protein A5660_20595 [Mycobacterium alsense]|uniref:serine/threonine-protein kinase n=1 Tax=Mycobacterium alsense TaxID=324058 RepID=UPI0007FC2A4D|nr:serine/threonine-protein kinase [Mycobacterium alsense]OBJ03346.1 hypothetical protein A5660_20595 [Mycobacterium alsense]